MDGLCNGKPACRRGEDGELRLVTLERILLLLTALGSASVVLQLRLD